MSEAFDDRWRLEAKGRAKGRRWRRYVNPAFPHLPVTEWSDGTVEQTERAEVPDRIWPLDWPADHQRR